MFINTKKPRPVAIRCTNMAFLSAILPVSIASGHGLFILVLEECELDLARNGRLGGMSKGRKIFKILYLTSVISLGRLYLRSIFMATGLRCL